VDREECAMSVVEVRDVWKDYGGQMVLERLNLTVPSGEFCTMVGPSGCGKTTFLRMLLSMEQPSRGTITLDGTPLPREPGPDRGVVFQRYSVFPHLTVLENVLLGLEFAGSPVLGRLFGRRLRVALPLARAVIEEVGLSEASDKYPGELSGGMQQRLAIAQTLVRRPKVLLLDEPFGALDAGTKVQMYELVRRLWRETGMSVFMVTHDLKEAFALATRVLAFDKVRRDPQAPGAYGATVTYDLPLNDKAERRELMERWKAGAPGVTRMERP
jgi:NitT/TauT family transport system ATP-binding protein